jgi:uncharacterized protein (DUF305 family)
MDVARRNLLFCFSVVVALTSGPAVRAQQTGHTPPSPQAGSKAIDRSEAAREMHEVMMRMNDEMGRMQMTGDPDHDFAMMMVPHHQTAIDMAKAELRGGSDPTIKAMARKIITAQEREIRQFKSWLAKHEAAKR